MAIDTLKVAKRLRDAGFSEPLAEALVAAVREGANDADLVTKRDLEEAEAELKSDIGGVRAETRQMELRLKLEIEASTGRTQARIIRMIFAATGVNIVAVFAAMFGLAKLMGH